MAVGVSAGNLVFQCPNCGEALTTADSGLVCRKGHRFLFRRGAYGLMPTHVNAVTTEEGQYHAAQKDTWIEQNQMDTPRNRRAHESFLSVLIGSHSGPRRILELGGGVGYDMQVFRRLKPDHEVYVFSDVSEELAEYVAASNEDPRLICCAADADHIPFAHNQFDCVFMVAAFHHLGDAHHALAEICRVTKSGGRIGFGIEPARWWLKLFGAVLWMVRPLFARKSHSAADEEAEGFRAGDFDRFARAHALRVIQIQRVWLLCGVLHFLLEFVHRLLRLRSRLRIPACMEEGMVRLDERLLMLPGVRALCWHYSVIFEKI